MPPPIQTSSPFIDLSARFKRTTTVGASPSAATETIIATLTITEDLVIVAGIQLVAWAAFTVGTNGVSANLKIRQTNASGSTIAASGATTQTAANLATLSAHGFDTGATLPGQVYVATLTVASGSAASTVSALFLGATII